MLTLKEMYQRGTLLDTMFKRMYYSNVEQHIVEFKDFVSLFHKDVQIILKSRPSEDLAYKIINIINGESCVVSMYFFVWKIHYEKKSSDRLKKILDDFVLSTNKKNRLCKKLKSSVHLITNEELKETAISLIKDAELSVYKSSDSIISKIKNINNSYTKNIVSFRKKKGFVVLNKEHDNWVNRASLSVFKENSKVLKQKGATLLVDNGQFYSNLSILKESEDRKEFYFQSQKTKPIDDLWFKSLKSKARLAKVEGFDNYISFITNENILNGKKEISQYLNGLLKQYEPSYLNVMNKIQDRAKLDNINSVKVWDVFYYLELLYPDDLTFENIFKIEDIFELLKSMFKTQFNIDVYYKKIRKKGINYIFTFKDENNKFVENVLFTNIDSSNLTIRHRELVKKKSPIGYSIINVAVENDGLISIFDYGVIFHEFGHMLQNFISKNRVNNLNDELWELIEIPSMLLEKFAVSFENMNQLSYYMDGSVKPKKLTKVFFNKLISEFKIKKDFKKYLEIKESLILLDLYTIKLKKLKKINPANILRHKLMVNNVPCLWSDNDKNFSNIEADYGALSYVYIFAENISVKLIEKIKSKAIIKDNAKFDLDYVFRELLTSNNGVASVNKIKVIFEELK